MSVVDGASGASAATITRGGSFTGAKTLTAEGAPTGATITFGTATLGAGVSTSTIAIATAATVTPGSYPIAIQVSGTGVTTASATLTLTVTAGVAPTIAVAVTSTLTPGTYPIVISAAGTGVTTATATLTIAVTAPVASGSVTLSYCAADAPIWVAYQDGTGPWTRVSATGTNTYTFSIRSGKAGVATVDTVGTGYNLDLTYATAAEFNSFGSALSLRTCGAKSVKGAVVNVSTSTQFVSVALGYSTTFLSPGQSSAFTLTHVPSGPQDLIASLLSGAGTGVEKIILRRGLDIADGGSLAVLDFNAAEAFAPATASVTVSGLGADTAYVDSYFDGTRGSTYGFLTTFDRYLASTGAVAYYAVPGAQLASGELQRVDAVVQGGPNSRHSGIYFRALTNQTIAMGPVLGAATVTRDATGPYSRTHVVLAQQTEYNRFFTAGFEQTSLKRSASIFATAGYVGSASWDLTIPDFTGATGWTNSWGLVNGTGITWNVSVIGGALAYFDASIADGTTTRSARRASATPLP